MAFTITRIPGQEKQSEDSFLKRAAINIPVQASLGVLDAVPGLLKTLSSTGPLGSVLGGSLPINTQEIERVASTAISGKPEYTSAQSFPEKVLYGIARDVPLALFTGGFSPRSLGRLAVSKVGSSAAEEAGLGDIGQAAAGFGLGAGVDYLSKGGRIGNLRKLAAKTAREDYSVLDKLGPQIETNAHDLRKGIFKTLNDAEKNLDYDLYRKLQRNVYKKLESIEDVGKTRASSLWETKKSLSKIGFDRSTPKELSPYYKRISGNIDKFLKQDLTGEKGKEFSALYSRANDLETGLRAQSAIRSMLEENTKLKNLVKGPLAYVLGGAGYHTGGIGGGLTGAALAAPLKLGARTIARDVDFIRNSSTVQKWIKDLGSEALLGDKAAFATTLKNLSKEFDKIEPTPQQEKFTITRLPS